MNNKKSEWEADPADIESSIPFEEHCSSTMDEVSEQGNTEFDIHEGEVGDEESDFPNDSLIKQFDGQTSQRANFSAKKSPGETESHLEWFLEDPDCTDYVYLTQDTEEDLEKFYVSLNESKIIESLTISNSPISPKKLAMALRSNTTLEELVLEGIDISSEGVKEIAAVFNSHTSLSKLEFFQSNIGQEGVREIAMALKSNSSSLQNFHLSKDDIGDEGAKKLQKP